MKIIFSDLDGTLLHKGEKSLNKNIKNSIYSVLENGIAFCIASGRTYIELKSFFKEFENDIYFICNDGSLGVFKEKTFFDNPVDKNMFRDFKEYTAHGKYITYVKSSRSIFVRNAARKYDGHIMTIDSIYDIQGDIYKISDFDKTVDCALPIVYKDIHMNEYVSKNSDKANAAGLLIDKLKIGKNNTYAFGDNINDINMFKLCGKSYAVANALPDVKKSAQKVTYNIENDFIDIIKAD